MCAGGRRPVLPSALMCAKKKLINWTLFLAHIYTFKMPGSLKGKRVSSLKRRSGSKKRSWSAKGRRRSFKGRRRSSKGRRSYKGRRHNNTSKSKTQVVTQKILGGSVVADKNRVRLPWRWGNTFSVSGLGAISYLQFKLNSIYDCGTNSAATNAQGYARYYTYYTRALVHSSHISVKFMSAVAAGDDQPVTVVVIPATSAQVTQLLAMTDMWAFQNQPHAKSRTFIPGVGGDTVNHYMHVQTLSTGTDSTPIATNTNFSAATGNDPVTNHSWMVLTGSTMQSTASIDVFLQVTITYYVEFFQPILQTSQALDIYGSELIGTDEEKAAYQREHARILVPVTETKKVFLEERKEEKKEEIKSQGSLQVGPPQTKVPAGWTLVKKT